MLRRACLVLLFALGIGLGTASAQPTIPDTPAGRTFKAWLTAFNSGDQKLIDAYYKKYQPNFPANNILTFRDETGGFTLLRILKSEPLELQVFVKQRKGETRAIGKLDVTPGEPAQVKDFVLRAIPPGVPLSAVSFNVDAAMRTRAIDGVIANLNEYYLFPKVAKKMDAAIRARQKSGAYNSVTDGNAFAAMLTKDLRAVSHDKHLRVEFSSAPEPKRPPAPNPAADAQYRKQMRRRNCGFRKVEILPGNIGYLKFNFFADPEVCGPTAIAAMSFLSGADALIFDLRDNGGGDPKMIQLICTYLFSKRTHLNNVWERKGDKTTQYWTLPYVPGKRLAGIPVYVLTSRRTFSGAEEFSYDLQNLKRATIVGETTGGGAHLVDGHRIDAHFMIGVPFAEAINPISKTNWEGTGVIPNVKAPAADALSTAEKLAEKQLAEEQTAAPKPLP